jgi:hypothetical protein
MAHVRLIHSNDLLNSNSGWKLEMLRKLCLIGALVVGSLILPVQADAGSAVGRTNAGGKYVHYGRNAGGKYVYRGSGTKFHTNPGGKYVYPDYSAWRPGR